MILKWVMIQNLHDYVVSNMCDPFIEDVRKLFVGTVLTKLTSPLSGFHVYHKITIWVPESCLLISIGLIVGGIMYSVHEEPPAVLTSKVFFLYMLPPIVLESGYFMPTSLFFENFGTVRYK